MKTERKPMRRALVVAIVVVIVMALSIGVYAGVTTYQQMVFDKLSTRAVELGINPSGMTFDQLEAAVIAAEPKLDPTEAQRQIDEMTLQKLQTRATELGIDYKVLVSPS